MTRSLAPRPRARPAVKRPPPDPIAIHYFWCMRCDRLMWSHEIVTECTPCINKAVRTFGLGPIQGETSGS